LNGIKSVGIIENIENPKDIYTSSVSHEGFRKTLEDLSHIVHEKILNLSLSNFLFKKSSVSYVAYIESGIMILVEYDNTVNFNLLKSKVDEFRNQILISF
jgi:hypothetical protein